MTPRANAETARPDGATARENGRTSRANASTARENGRIACESGATARANAGTTRESGATTRENGRTARESGRRAATRRPSRLSRRPPGAVRLFFAAFLRSPETCIDFCTPFGDPAARAAQLSTTGSRPLAGFLRIPAAAADPGGARGRSPGGPRSPIAAFH